MKLLEKVDYNKMRFKEIMLISSVMLIILAMMQPQFGIKKQIITKAGIDIVFALDVSESMLAEDIKPNRLSKAKYEISKLVTRFKGDRVGLVIFSGSSFVQVPLTHDYAVFNMFLDTVTTESIELPGTNISESLEKSLELFDPKETTSKVVILLTDGEDTVEDSVKVAEKAAKMNVKIYTVGVGSPKGARIPEFDENNNRVGFKKDREGNIITTKLDVKTLQKIALETKANSYIAGSGDMDLGKILEKISQAERKAVRSKHYGIYEDQFQWPLLGGVILLCIATFLPEIRISSKAMRCVILFFIITVLFCSEGYTLTHEAVDPVMKPESVSKKQNIPVVSKLTGLVDRTYKKIIDGIRQYNNEKYDKAFVEFNKLTLKNPEKKELHLNTGSSLYKSRKYDKAIKEYEDALYSKNIDIKTRAYYNIANSYFRKNKLQKALEYYKKTLELKPGDTDAKYNIEVIRKKLKENAQKQNKKQQQKKQQQKKQQQKKQQQKKQQQNKKEDQKKDSSDEQQKKDQKGKQDQKQQKKDQKEKQDQKQQKKDQEGKQDQKQQKKDQGKKKKMSRKEAEKMLKQIMDMEKDNLKNRKKRKMKSRGRYNVEKDW